ncbi:DUF6716 putative glycosyltransferase [Tritonibacter mobilis]|uniref:DUF6716 putative glycosyltransferase n=1 Tax=Tritonibacter mobilis TaxID=379347 RepID=UPI000806D4D2|nr:DUF6716 putative glycosyltransferase [Tritonibacter mobilis]
MNEGANSAQLSAASGIQSTGPLPFLKRPVLLLFSDDSTLFFALRMRDCLQATDLNLEIELGWVVNENALSYRQMSQLLPEGPNIAIHGKNGFSDLLSGQSYSAVLTSRVYGPLGAQLRREIVSVRAGRPCILAFLGGLDFFPQNGYFRRRHCDGVYLFPQSELSVYSNMAENWNGIMWQDVNFGHPSLLAPKSLSHEDLADRRDIYFFTQALSPTTRRGRLHMLNALSAIARANPDRTVWIKLRHLPGENEKHLHREKHDYPALMAELPRVPENLKITACTMDEALEAAALGITCTSTAAVDVIREGVPCMVHLDFVDNYLDPLVEPMRKLFAESGLITSLHDMLNLRDSSPNSKWLNDMFCTHDLGARIMNTIARFSERPFQVQHTRNRDLAMLQARFDKGQI